MTAGAVLKGKRLSVLKGEKSTGDVLDVLVGGAFGNLVN